MRTSVKDVGKAAFCLDKLFYTLLNFIFNVAVGILPGPLIFNSADLSSDQQFEIVEAIFFCMQWIEGVQSLTEDWRGDLSSATGDPFGTADFTLRQGVIGSGVACGSYEVQFTGEVSTGDIRLRSTADRFLPSRPEQWFYSPNTAVPR